MAFDVRLAATVSDDQRDAVHRALLTSGKLTSAAHAARLAGVDPKVASAALYQLLDQGRVERVNQSGTMMAYKWRAK